MFASKRIASAACCALLLAACGGGSSGTSSSSGSSGSTGTTTVTSASLQSVNNLPDFNVESLDAAASASESAQLSRYTVDESERRFSRAGCEIRSHVEEFKWQIKELRSNVCIVKKMESEAGMEVGEEAYNYYSMEFEAGEVPGGGEEGGSADFGFGARIRVGLIDDTLHMALCTNEATGSTYEQQMAMTFGVTDGKFDGVVKDIQLSNDENIPDGAFSIEALLATDDPEVFSEGDQASFLAQMNSSWGAGHVGLDITKPDGVILNVVDAAFRSGDVDAEWGTWTSQIYGEYDPSEGCATWSSEGTFPAMLVSDAFDEFALEELAAAGFESTDQFCWANPDEAECEDEDGCTITDFITEATDGMCSFEEGGAGSTECFSFELNNGTLGYFELSAEEAAYYDAVAAHEGLDDFEAPTIAFEGDEIWDCEAEADNEFVAIDPSDGTISAAFEECFAINEDGGRSMESCYEKESQEDVQDEAGVEVHDEDQEFGDDSGGGDSGDDSGDNSGDQTEVDCDTDCTQAGEHQSECESMQADLSC